MTSRNRQGWISLELGDSRFKRIKLAINRMNSENIIAGIKDEYTLTGIIRESVDNWLDRFGGEEK